MHHTVNILLPDDQTLQNLLMAVLKKSRVEQVAAALKQVFGRYDLEAIRDELEH